MEIVTEMLKKAGRLILRAPQFLARLWEGSVGRKQLFTTRRHKSYDDYLAKQLEKTTDPLRIQKWKTEEWDSKVQGFIGVFRGLDVVLEKTSALCLGSRTGQEVFALQTLGAKARGIDLVAFPPYTEEGDVHDLRFKNGTFSLVFSNIFDHVLYPEKFASEASRVLTPGGLLVLRIQLGFRGDDFTETFVTSGKAMRNLFGNMALESSHNLKHQFDGMHLQLIFRKE